VASDAPRSCALLDCNTYAALACDDDGIPTFVAFRNARQACCVSYVLYQTTTPAIAFDSTTHTQQILDADAISRF